MPTYKQLGNDFFIGPAPTEQDLADARREGVRTVIDLRTPAESAVSSASLAARCGLGYVNIPVDKTALSIGLIDELEAAVENNAGSYLLHCASGMRAAMLLALSRARQHGWTAERTFAEAESMGFNLRHSPGFAAFVIRATET